MDELLRPSEALFGFAAWLTCRDATLTLGAKHSAAEIVPLVQAFIESQGLEEVGNNYGDFLKPFPEI